MSNNIIQNIQKQNDSIYSSLLVKNIQFERIIIPEGVGEEEHIRLLNEENTKLKEMAKASRPPAQPIKEKKQILQPVQVKKVKEDKELDEELEETFEEPVKKFDVITNMEDMKRAFFNGDYETFENIFLSNPFKIYRMNYKYNSDKDGVPDFSAKNLLKGFVRNFDDYRKYFMICFRCLKAQDKNEYKYDSYWIVNSNEPVQNIIGDFFNDFEPDDSFDLSNQFVNNIKKLPETDEPILIDGYNCIGEAYVH